MDQLTLTPRRTRSFMGPRTALEARDEKRLLNPVTIDELGFVPLSPCPPPERNCSSRSSASATSGAPSWSPPTSPSTNGL